MGPSQRRVLKYTIDFEKNQDVKQDQEFVHVSANIELLQMFYKVSRRGMESDVQSEALIGFENTRLRASQSCHSAESRLW